MLNIEAADVHPRPRIVEPERRIRQVLHRLFTSKR
jgi:hypothetical protein